MLRYFNFICVLSILILAGCTSQSSMRVVKTFKIGGDGGWDYIALNDQKLYVSHSTQVNIIDENTGDSLGIIEGTAGVHGIAFDEELKKGYTSNGKLNNVFVFDLGTNKIIKQIATGDNPDAIMLEPFSNEIITCNGKGNSLSIIDPNKDSVVATIDVMGRPEEAASDGKGMLYVNLEDKNEIAVVDLKTNTLVNRWAIRPGEGATGLAIDTKTNRLFAGCDNKKLMVLDSRDGKIITSLPIGEGCDGVVFNEGDQMIYTSNGEGNITAIKEDGEGKFKVTETIATMEGARTLTIDKNSGTLYLPFADREPGKDGERGKVKPGTFGVLVVR